MKKILVSLLALVFIMLNVVTTSAFSISNSNQATDLFPTGSVSVNGNKITLLKNINAVAQGEENTGEYLDYNEPIVFESGTYVVELDGNILCPNIENGGYAYIIKSGANVTIQNSSSHGCGIYGGVKVEEGGTLKIVGVNDCFISVGSSSENGCEILNNGTLILENVSMGWAFLNNDGNLTINGGNVSWGTSFNSGKVYINGGNFNGISQFGGELYISDCQTASGVGGLYISIDSVKTELSGGMYNPVIDEKDGTVYPGVVISVKVKPGQKINEAYVLDFISDGYKGLYSGFKTVKTGEDQDYEYYDISYDSLKIFPLPEKYSEVMKKITTEEKWTVYADAPENSGDSEFLLSAIAKNLIDDKGYDVWAVCNDEPFNPNRASIYIADLETGDKEKYYVAVEYKKPDAETQKAVDAMVKKMKDSSTDEWKWYTLDDLYLVNYLTTIGEGEMVDDSTAINFSKQFIDEVGAGKFSFAIDARLGDGDWFYAQAGGHTIVMYNGKVYATTQGGITYKNVIYVPEDTANNSDAYIKAALKRITDYFGDNCNISLKVGGEISELGNDLASVQKKLGATISGDHYYILSIGECEYEFVVSKTDDETQFEAPKYKGSDLMSKIQIHTTDKSVPLDTKIMVSEVRNDTIKNALGTDVYTAYDITLYSSSLGSNITKLENGKFTVSIPVPSELEGKRLTVFYIASDGTKEEHTVTIVDNLATFETDHFSTYALTELKTNLDSGSDTNSGKDKLNTDSSSTSPETRDNTNTLLWLVLFIISGGFLTTFAITNKIEIQKNK